SMIQERKINVEAAFQEFTDKYTATLSAIDDAYLRERASDLRDISARVMNNLLGYRDNKDLQNLREPCIVIAEDLSPSEAAMLDRKVVLGFATEAGGRTSHTAIMARSLQMPAIVGLVGASTKITSGMHLLLDGYN